ncbi:unnamed protein product [Ranitomeya imitator]|uniref:Reverse transcriptase domain-containing protein n=1 Tax=Ranitomeya imitator TaxID=111125 RepID=A0ABN9KZV2_9NEOB|nr:unnamed protein product [Ranitomeya imitator]
MDRSPERREERERRRKVNTGPERRCNAMEAQRQNKGEVGPTKADEEGLRNQSTSVPESELSHRNLRLKVHFSTADFMNNSLNLSSDSTPSTFNLKSLKLSIPSNYNPPKLHHPVETYISLGTQDIQNRCIQIGQGLLSVRRNCTPLEKRALDSLKNNKSITIKPADKGGAIVVMDSSYYTSIVYQHLNDKDTYLPVDRDPTPEISLKIQQLIKLYKDQNVIDSKLGEFMLNRFPVVPVFYVLPKIHKHPTRPPGRPIVASTNSLLSPIAQTIEKILTPLLIHITSFIKDTSDFLMGLRSMGTIPGGCYLVTMDVNNLYTSIDHTKGLNAVHWFLNTYTDFSSMQKEFCLTMLDLVLSKNFFMFADQFFIQKVGTVIGSNVAPPYANIFMAFFEENFVYTHHLYIQHSVCWKRFIDDVFLIWKGDELSLTQFLLDMNSMVPNLTFTMVKDQHKVSFLDTLVIMKEDGTLDIDLYVKSTDRNSLLEFSSCHPVHVKRSLPKSQIERIKRIVTRPDVREQRIHEMQTKFRDRGYPSTIFDRATEQRDTRPQRAKRVAFVTTYHPYTNYLKKPILEHWSLLGKAYPTIPEFMTPPLLCYKRPHNIKNILVKADVGSTKRDLRQATLATQRKGTFPCLRCSQCSNVTKGEMFSHPRSGKLFPIKGFFTCDSAYVIYLIKCPCGLGYVGETTQHIRDRISQHKSTIRCGRTLLPVPAHFISAGHSISQLRFQVLESIPPLRRGTAHAPAFSIVFLRTQRFAGGGSDVLERTAFILALRQYSSPQASVHTGPTCLHMD